MIFFFQKGFSYRFLSPGVDVQKAPLYASPAIRFSPQTHTTSSFSIPGIDDRGHNMLVWNIAAIDLVELSTEYRYFRCVLDSLRCVLRGAGAEGIGAVP